MATIPAGFGLLNRSGSGDGAEFARHSDRNTIIAVFGRLAQQDIMDDREERLGWMAERYDVTYAPVGSDWYVLSGTTADGAIVYTRTQSLTACDGRLVYGTMLFEYDAAEKTAIDPLIGPATQTLAAAPCN